MKKLIGFILLMFLGYSLLFAQVAINTDASAPDNSSMLDVKSTTKGILVPRMTSTQRNAIVNPATGLMVFCTDNNLYYSNSGTPSVPVWVVINSPWLRNGADIFFNTGNVGIGATSPICNLDIQGDYSAVLQLKSTLGGTAALRLDRATALDYGTVLFVTAGTATWNMGMRGNNDFSLYNLGTLEEAINVNAANENVTFLGKIGIKAVPGFDLTVSSTDYYASFISTNYSGGTTIVIQAPPGLNPWGIYADANLSGYAGYFSGNVYCTGTYQPSDERLKENIEPVQNVLEKVMELNVKTYEFKQEFTRMNLPTSMQYGFTAQNLETVFPELVRDNPAKGKEQPVEFKAVNYTGMIPILTAAIQEQQTMMEELKNQNAELLRRMEKLENK